MYGMLCVTQDFPCDVTNAFFKMKKKKNCHAIFPLSERFYFARKDSFI